MVNAIEITANANDGSNWNVSGLYTSSNTSTAAPCTAPVITTQPVAPTVCAGTNSTISVAATGSSLTYDWQYSDNGGASYASLAPYIASYPGANTATVTIPGGQSSSRLFRVAVSSSTCTTNSNGVSITYVAPPTITAQPVAPSVCAGASATYTVTATGTGLTYDWQYSDNGSSYASLAPFAASYPGYNTASMTTTTNGGTRTYRVVITNGSGCSVTSNAVGATVNPLPVIGTQPTSQTVCAGANATLTVAASGTSLTYDWQFSDNGGTSYSSLQPFISTYPGANTASVTIPPTQSAARLFRVVITGAGGCTTNSSAVGVTYVAYPTITAQPVAPTVCSGSSATYSVTASGTGLTYLWYYSDNGTTYSSLAPFAASYPGYNTASMTTTANTSIRTYRVVVTNSTGCSVTSNAVGSTVNPTPATPTLSGTTATNTCPATTVNLNALVTSTAASGTTLVWYTNNAHTGAAYATPTTAAAGTYYAFYTNSSTGCFSAATAAVTAAVGPCGTCNAGNTAPTLSSPNGCGSSFNLNSLVTSTAPAGTAVEFHTAATPTAGNKVTNASTAPAGTYYAFYYDATNNCYSPNSQVITVANPVTPTLAAGTQPTCGTATGTFTISNYSASYTYAVSPSTGTSVSGTGTVTAPAGTYTVTATAANGCVSSASASQTINAQPATPATPTLAAASQTTCASANGTITISNYSAALTYTVSPATGVSQSGATITAPAGTYTVTATNGTCTSAASAAQIINAQPATPVAPALAAGTQPTCATATGTFSISNYSAANTYTVSPSTGTSVSGTGVVTAPAGSYTVTATNGSGCTSAASASQVINAQPATPATPTLAAGTQPTCSSATGTFTISNYSAALAYTVSPATGVSQSGATITAPAGTYTVTASNPNCTSAASASQTLNTPPVIPAPVLSSGTVSNACPCEAAGANLATKVTSTAPTGYTLEWHTGSTPTAANQVTDPTSVPSGTYYAFYTNGTCYSSASTVITATYTPCTLASPDLTPTIDIDGQTMTTGQSRDFVVNLYEQNGVATSGKISFRIAKLLSYDITYPFMSGNSNVFGGTAVSNSNWDITEDANFIYVVSKPGVGMIANDQASIGFNITRTSGNSYTAQNIVVTIDNGAGSETYQPNNFATTSLQTN